MTFSELDGPRKVEARLGAPDVIGERAGDLGRAFTPDDPPEYVWRVQRREFYYTGPNLMVAWERGRLCECGRIETTWRQLTIDRALEHRQREKAEAGP